MLDNMEIVLIGDCWTYVSSSRVQPGKWIMTGNPIDGSPLSTLNKTPATKPMMEPYPFEMLKNRTQTS